MNSALFTRREVMALSALAMAGVALPFPCIGAVADYGFDSLPPLRETAESHGLYYGCAVSAGALLKDKRYARALATECNLLVAENAMKWDSVWPAPDTWNFESGNIVYDFAAGHDQAMRGHALMWQEAFPAWALAALDQGRGQALMEAYIHKVVSYYKGKLISWDVVNEGVDQHSGRADGLAVTPWLKALGPAYIEQAFRLAAAADPGTQLVYSDFRMEVDHSKAKAVLALLRRLKDKGVPVHACGLHAHLNLDEGLEPLAAFCKDVAAMGLEIIVAELDIFESPRVWAMDDKQRDALVADKTRAFLDKVFSAVKPKQILTWGVSDRYSWLSDAEANPRNAASRRIRGLPLDAAFIRKPMWHVLHEFLSKA